jgi:NAD+ kinase
MLLRAAHAAVEAGIPIVGINRGHLGFLADIHPEKMVLAFSDIFKGNYTLEKRFLLSATVDNQHYLALNDFVLSHDDNNHMIDMSIQVDQDFLCHQRADGLIISTPTGSTAYALSAGGPILHPELDAMVLVPMFPHRLTSRPIVISSDHAIGLTLAETSGQAKLSCDGQTARRLMPGQHLHITRHSKPLSLLHPIGYDYFTTLRSKLLWEA